VRKPEDSALVDLSSLPSTSLAGKIARYPLKLLPRGMVVPILQGPLKGKKWIVGSQRHAFWLGSYEPHLQKLIAREVEQSGEFYDIGANVGFYSLLASTLIKDGQVFAFEPLPANVGYLRRHLELNGIRNVQVLEVAISDRVGTSFFQEEETGAMGRLEAGGNRRVATDTLDSLIRTQQLAPPRYIKMDIEGEELKALLGARACFERYKPKLFLATHGKEVHEECCRLLQSWSFEVRLIGSPGEDRAEILARSRSEIFC
jgi:FkbM family methyltransferase